MRWKFNTPLGSCMPRGIPTIKQEMFNMIGQLGSAQFGANASFISDVFGNIENIRTNHANRDIAKETNAANYKIWQEQLAAQKAQWQAERDEARYLKDLDYQRYLQYVRDERLYNDPKQQRDRLLNAGINPAFAMQNGSGFGSVSSGTPPANSNVNSSSVPAAPEMITGAPEQAYTWDKTAQGAIAAAQMMQNAFMNEFQMAFARQKLDIETLETLSKVRANDAMSGKTVAEMNKVIDDLQFNQQNLAERSRGLRLANDKIHADQLYQEELTRGLKFANDVAPQLNELEKKRLAAEIANASAMTAELNSRTDLNSKQKELVQKQINEQCIKNAQLPKQLHNENAIRVATYNQIKKQAALVETQTRTQEWYEMDAKKGYNHHTGNDRTLFDLIEIEMRRNPIKPK